MPDDQRIWLPYCGAAPSPADWLAAWNLDPFLLIALAAAALAWLRWAAAADPLRPGRFWASWGLVVLLFVSPLCALSSALFSVRIVHHVVLTTVIAPLLATSMRADRIRVPGGLPVWTAAHIAILWLWHAPPVYALALSNDAVFWAMQLTLAASAAGFWAAIRRSSAPAAVAMLLIAMMAMGLLGALITFAAIPLYRPHLLTTVVWGYSPLEDQQLAGLIMWAPAALAYLGAALFLLGRAMAREERAAAPS